MNNDPIAPNQASMNPPSAPMPPRRSEGPRTASGLGCLFTISILFNIAAFIVLVLVCGGLFWNYSGGGWNPGVTEAALTEKTLSGSSKANDKVAVVHLDGVIMEGALNFVHKQIEQAAKDKHVKAVVLRVNSPGGSITASDELYRRLNELKNGNSEKNHDGKPLVVSMASMAASGGYYVSMPGQVVYAEQTTLTGSIGVYASFPNISGWAETYKLKMETIKAGNIKDSGSPFKEMTPEERRVWQDMVNTAYNQFLDVVVQGRSSVKLKKEDLLKKFDVTPVQQNENEKPNPKEVYQRYLADGGVWTADKAKEHNLIDKIGTLQDAVKEAHDLAGMGTDFKAVEYEKPKSLSEMLLGVRQNPAGGLNTPLLDPARLRNGLTPRMWYLAPGCEIAGILAGVEAEQN